MTPLQCRPATTSVQGGRHARNRWSASSGTGGRLRRNTHLAYNVFEYWRQQEDRETLRRALGLNSSIDSIRFEGKFSTGLGGPAHIDVVLEAGDRTVAVESKFLEPFWSANPYATFSKRYFSEGVARWTDVGLPRCEALAEQVYTGELEFLRLDVPQLLKHALGLWRLGEKEVSLWYLYLEIAGNVGVRHRMELERFEESVGDEIGFKALPYNQVTAPRQPSIPAPFEERPPASRNVRLSARPPTLGDRRSEPNVPRGIV